LSFAEKNKFCHLFFKHKKSHMIMNNFKKNNAK